MINTQDKLDAVAEFAQRLASRFEVLPWGKEAMGVVSAILQEIQAEAVITRGEDVSNPGWTPPTPPE